MYNIGYSITRDDQFNVNTNSIQFMFKSIEKDIKFFKKLIQKYNYKHIFIHSSFKVNIASDFINDINPSIEIFDKEIIAMKKLNIHNIVLHCGNNQIYENQHVLNNMKKFILHALNTNMNIFLETVCKKNDMLVNLKDYVNFILSFKNEKNYGHLYSCIDTCHIFQAGYDLNDDKIIKKIHVMLKPIKNKITLIHLNNSKYPCGLNKDYHTVLNKGMIQFDKLINFVFKYKNNCCFILENATPLSII